MIAFVGPSSLTGLVRNTVLASEMGSILGIELGIKLGSKLGHGTIRNTNDNNRACNGEYNTVKIHIN
jgi:hypothetical protein